MAERCLGDVGLITKKMIFSNVDFIEMYDILQELAHDLNPMDVHCDVTIPVHFLTAYRSGTNSYI